MTILAFLGKVFVTNVIDALTSAKLRRIAASLVPHLLVYLILTNASAMISCGLFVQSEDYAECVESVQDSSLSFLESFEDLGVSL